MRMPGLTPFASAAAVTGPSSGSSPSAGASAAGLSARPGRARRAARSSKPGMRTHATIERMFYTNTCSLSNRPGFSQDVPVQGSSWRFSMNRTVLQRIALFGGPLGLIVFGLIHPISDPEVGEEANLFLLLHLILPILIGLMGYALWTLVEGLPGLAAKVARFAVVPFLIAYTAFESIIGTAKGIVITEAADYSAADQATIQRVFDGDHWAGYLVYIAGGLSWLVAAVAVAIAVRQIAPLYVSLLLGIGGAIFALGHPKPPGPIGMTLFLIGVALLELRYRPQHETAEAYAAPKPA